MVNTESAYACVQEDAPDPTLVSKAWNVYDKSAGSHVPDKKLKMIPIADENEKPETPESLKQDINQLHVNSVTQWWMIEFVFGFEHSLDQMRICLEDLADTINYQESQRDALK